MSNMTEHESNSVVKMLYVGDSGAGKTGSLASLIDEGLKINALDLDNGLSVLKGYVKDKSKLANVHYVTLRDDLKLVGNRVGVSKASAFQRAMELLDKGGDLWGKGSGIGPIDTWGPDTILLVDSLSKLGRASLQMVMAANAAGFKAPEIQHYGTAMDNIEQFLDLITSDAVKCHVIVCTHTTMPEGSTKVYPEALGSKLSPKVAKPFDNMISISLDPGNAGRTIKTQRDGLLALKTAIPLQASYPISTGMADIFKTLLGKKELV